MSTPARATAVLTAGSVVSLVAGAATAKWIALQGGPVGVGVLGLLSSLLALTVMVAGLGIGVGLVRAVAPYASRGPMREVVALRSSGRRIVLSIAVVASSGIFLLRVPIAARLLGDETLADQVALVALAALFGALATVESGVINGLHQVRTAAIVTAFSASLLAIGVFAAVTTFGVRSIGSGLVVGTFGGWVVSLLASARLTGTGGGHSSVPRVRDRVVALVQFGAPYTLSQVATTGAQLLLPFVVLASLGPDEVGFYRAASTLSVAYLAFLLSAMAQDYYPRLSALDGPERVGLAARDQLRFVLAVSIPVVLVASAAAPLALVVLYSADFAPAVDLLRWQFIGDVVKLPSWVLAFVLLAKGRSSMFLRVEIVWGIAMIAFTAIALRTVGLVGVGLAYVATYAVYYVAVLLASRHLVRMDARRELSIVLVVAIGLVGAQLARPLAGDLLISVTLVVVACLWGALVTIPWLRAPASLPAA